MIYLITGTPGTGKTSKAVKMLIDNEYGITDMPVHVLDDDGNPTDKISHYVRRPIFANHIDGLDFEGLKVHKLDTAVLTSAPLNEIVPVGALVFVDECDYAYPTRSAAKEVPLYIKTLKELRHEGFTLVLMTQDGSMIDSYVRMLIGKHIHIERRQIGSFIYEFNKYQSNLSETVLKLGSPSRYKPDKRTFKYYKSASVHIGFKKKLHWIFYLAAILIPLATWQVYKAYSRIDDASSPDVVSQDFENYPDSGINDVPMVDKIASSPSVASPNLVGTEPEDYSPRMIDKPETAPVYDGVRQVRSMEMIVGCVDSSKGCNCYSDQATIVNVPAGTCKQILKDGVYNPFLAPPSERFPIKETIKKDISA